MTQDHMIINKLTVNSPASEDSSINTQLHLHPRDGPYDCGITLRDVTAERAQRRAGGSDGGYTLSAAPGLADGGGKQMWEVGKQI